MDRGKVVYRCHDGRGLPSRVRRLTPVTALAGILIVAGVGSAIDLVLL